MYACMEHPKRNRILFDIFQNHSDHCRVVSFNDIGTNLRNSNLLDYYIIKKYHLYYIVKS